MADNLEKTLEDSIRVSDPFQHLNQLAAKGNLIPEEAESDYQAKLDARSAMDRPTEPEDQYQSDMDYAASSRLVPTEPVQALAPAPVEAQAPVEAPVSTAQSVILDLMNLPTRAAGKKYDFNKLNTAKAKIEPVYNVIALNSGYKASMRSISLSIKEAMVENQKNTNFYDRELQSATAVYNCIHSMNIDKPTFQTWCDSTAYQDINTLQYGMLARTYPRPFEFAFTCTNDKCKASDEKSDARINISVTAEDFIAISEEETVNRISEIIQECKTLNDLREKNHVFNSVRSVVDDSDNKIIIDIRNAFSVTNILDTIQAFSSKEMQNSASIIFFLAAIENILIFNEEDGCYDEFSEPRQIFNIMKSDWFQPAWSDFIEKKVDEYSKPYQVTYQIPTTSCPHCGKKQSAKPVNIEQLLFFKMTGQM